MASELKNKAARKAMCWKCKAELIYMESEKLVKCHACKTENDMQLNNGDNSILIKCTSCKNDLMIPEGAFRIFCQGCSTVFSYSKQQNQLYKELEVLDYFT